MSALPRERERHCYFSHYRILLGSSYDRLMAANLVLISTMDCHLCAHAREVLRELDLEAREIDATSAEAQSLAREGVPLTFMPVLLDGHRVVAYGRLSLRRLKKDLVP